MTVHAEQLASALRTIHPGSLSAGDAEAIVALAQMSVDADGAEDADEIQMFFALGKSVYELAGLTETPQPSLFDEDEADARVTELAGQLTTPSARELAYAVAHLLSVVDVQIAPEEDAFLEKLRGALNIGEERADELASQLSAAITPVD